MLRLIILISELGLLFGFISILESFESIIVGQGCKSGAAHYNEKKIWRE